MHYKIIWDKNSIWIKCFPFPSQVIYWQWIDTKELESFSFDWGCVHISGNSQGPNQSNLYFQNSLSSFYSGKVRLAIQNLSHLSTHPSRLFSSLFFLTVHVEKVCLKRKQAHVCWYEQTHWHWGQSTLLTCSVICDPVCTNTSNLFSMQLSEARGQGTLR